MKPFIWIEARTPEQAVAELGQAGKGLGAAVLKAGGVDLLDRMKEGLDQPARVINLRRLTGHGMSEVKELPPAGDLPARLHLGALVTLARLAEDPLVRRHFPALADAAAGAATPQVRQAATLGGNLLQRPRCWYLRSLDHVCKKKGGTTCFAQEGENDYHAIFDNTVCAVVHPSAAATPLFALQAGVVVLGAEGEGRMRLEDLLLSPGDKGANLQREHRLGPAQVLTAVEVPLPRPGERSVYLKVKQKQSFDWPLGEVAVVCAGGGPEGPVRSARIVLGAAAPIPWRARGAEIELLKLSRLDDAGLRRVGAAAIAGARPLAKNGYKLPLLSGLVQRAVRLAVLGQDKGGGD